MKTACVILAAGAGRRLGGRNKALLEWAGKTFLERIVESGRDAGVEEFVVVVGEPHRAQTQELAEHLGACTVVNPDPDRGMASSVSLGFGFALQKFESGACWLWPVDSPGIKTSTLLELVRAATPEHVVTPRVAGRGGHPSLVGRKLWPELAACVEEPEGARTVFRRDSSRRLFVDETDPAIVHDVDEPRDLERIPC